MNEPDLTPLETGKFDGVDPEADLDALERREYRARTNLMVVIPTLDRHGKATGEYAVITESASPYMVTFRVDRDVSCTCPDWQNRAPAGGCKHIRRVIYEGKETPLPAEDESAADYFETLDERMTAIGNRTIEYETRAADLRRVMATVLENLPDSADIE